MILKNKKEQIKRRFFVILFSFLVVIDVVRNVGNDWQMTLASQAIGTVVGMLIILHYGIKSFLKWYNLIWIIVYGILIWSMKYWFYQELIKIYYLYETYLALFNMCLFGMIVTGMLITHVKERDISNVIKRGVKFDLKTCLLATWLLYMILAVVQKDNTYRPEFYLIYFAVFYLVRYKKEEILRLLEDLCNGILIGFWGIQLLAFVFRPYVDSHLRYSGMYYNSNIFDLMCLIVLMIILLKATNVRRNRSIKNVFYWFWILQYGVVWSFIILSVGRLTIILAMIMTGLYTLYILLICDKLKIKRIALIGFVTLISICLMLPLTYMCASYIPRVLKKPLSFVDEYRKWGDLESEENYVSFEEIVYESLGRFATLFIDYQEVNESRNDANLVVTDNRPLDSEWETKTYYLDEENYNSVNLRVAIWRTYLDEVNWNGHTVDEWMLWVSPHERAWHSHNLFIMQLYVYGIAAGIAFIVWIFCYGLCMWKYSRENRQSIYNLLPFAIFVLFIGFGMFELDHMYGQISWNLIFILQKCVLNSQCRVETDS